MQSKKNTLSRRLITKETTIFPKAPEVGLVLMDMSLKPIAIDRGASSILSNRINGSMSSQPSNGFLPSEILEMVEGREPAELSASKLTLRVGSSDYACRAYVIEANNRIPAMIALHIEKVSSTTDAVTAVAAKFSLTDREQETLRGISMGLSSKELAERMGISPNTVKVFLRLIMIKMGVTSRGAIIAQILQNQSKRENHDERALTAGV